MFSRTLLVVSAILVAGCGGSPHDAGDPTAATVAVDVSIDSLFPLQATTGLDEHPDHVISGLSGVTNSVIDRDGNILMADFRMHEFKVFDRRGNFVEVLGRAGQGPGEYAAPVSVALSPSGNVFGLADLGLSRVLLFEQRTRELIRTVQLALPISLQDVLLGRGDTLIALGNAADYYGADPPYQAAIVARGDSVRRRLLPIPPELRMKAMGGSILAGFGDQTASYLYLGISGYPVIYRYRYDGEVVDSVRLPPEVYDGVSLPEVDEWEGGPGEMQDYVQTQTWVYSVTALRDSRLVIEIAAYDLDEDDWMSRFVLVDWAGDPRAWSTEPCACEIAGHRGDTLAVLAGGPPDPFRIEWRTVRGF